MEIVLAAQALRPQTPSRGAGAASWQAAWISLVLHASALAALCTLFLPNRLPDAPAEPGIAIFMAQPPDAATEQSLPESPLISAPRAIVSYLAAPRPLSLAPARARPNQPMQAAAAPAHAVPAPPTAVAAETSHAVAENVLSGLETSIRKAVQDAAIYPAAARFMHLQGRTQVRFDYADGTAATLCVATSSSSPILDRAALAAVRNAALPRAPALIGARKLALLVWVDFHLVQQD